LSPREVFSTARVDYTSPLPVLSPATWKRVLFFYHPAAVFWYVRELVDEDSFLVVVAPILVDDVSPRRRSFFVGARGIFLVPLSARREGFFFFFFFSARAKKGLFSAVFKSWGV